MHYYLGSSGRATYMETHPYKDCFTHGPRALTMKNLRALENHLKAIPWKFTEIQSLLLFGPQVQCEVKVDHVERLQHILWTFQDRRYPGTNKHGGERTTSYR